MSVEKRLFGKLSNNSDVFEYTLKNSHGMIAKLITYGAAITQLWVPDRNGVFADVVGGYDTAEKYEKGNSSQGAVVGRVGNRICDGKFTLDGVEYSLYVNDRGVHLHGGKVGYDHRNWDSCQVSDNAVCFSLVSPDGEEGYPGTLKTDITYTLTEENGLSIHYEATTDKATILNLTNHAYFNIGGFDSGDILDNELIIDADTYLATDEMQIPTGELRSVEGTPFDFRRARRIGDDIASDNADIKIGKGYDHCFNFCGGESETPIKRCEVYDAKSGRVMSVYTDQPCVQLYTANFLGGDPLAFKNGYKPTDYSMLCLETQHMPDSINHENFTNSVLRPSEKYDYTTEYRFSIK